MSSKKIKKLLVNFLAINIVNKYTKFGGDIRKRYRLKVGAVGDFYRYLRLQGDHYWACAKSGVISSFFTSFRTKK